MTLWLGLFLAGIVGHLGADHDGLIPVVVGDVEPDAAPAAPRGGVNVVGRQAQSSPLYRGGGPGRDHPRSQYSSGSRSVVALLSSSVMIQIRPASLKG